MVPCFVILLSSDPDKSKSLDLSSFWQTNKMRDALGIIVGRNITLAFSLACYKMEYNFGPNFGWVKVDKVEADTRQRAAYRYALFGKLPNA